MRHPRNKHARTHETAGFGLSNGYHAAWRWPSGSLSGGRPSQTEAAVECSRVQARPLGRRPMPQRVCTLHCRRWAASCTLHLAPLHLAPLHLARRMLSRCTAVRSDVYPRRKQLITRLAKRCRTCQAAPHRVPWSTLEYPGLPLQCHSSALAHPLIARALAHCRARTVLVPHADPRSTPSAGSLGCSGS